MSDPEPTPGEGGVIIIKGGSCEINFDENVFQYEATGNQQRKHKHDSLKIQRIVITGNHSYDSKDITGGFKGEIRITCKP